MARAKRTARSEARRRHREQLRAEEQRDATAEPALEPEPPAEQPRSWWRAVTSGLFSIPDVRGDLRALPWIARHTYALALPFAATAVAFGVGSLDSSVLSQSQPGEPVTAVAARALFQFVLVPPNVTVVFVAAVLAPRAGWLVGPIVGLVGTGAYLALLAIRGPSGVFNVLLDPLIVLQSLLALVFTYMLLGAFASWYRRWLTQMNERNRQRAEERRKAQQREARRAKTSLAKR